MRRHQATLGWIAIAGIAVLTLQPVAQAGVEEDWQAIIASEAGPPGTFGSRKSAQEMALAHLAQQEQMLRRFCVLYPADPRVFDANIRLVHLLATRSDLMAKDTDYLEGLKLLEKMGKAGTLSKARKADLAFARTTLAMRRAANADLRQREDLIARARNFQNAFPEDRRVPALLTEVATLCDGDPKRKEALLRDALKQAKTPELQGRIHDDLKRIGMLGKPLQWEFTSVQGESITLNAFKGRIVLIYFFADWSPPARLGLEEVAHIAAEAGQETVQVIAVSLDASRDAPRAALKENQVNWPLFCDERGWESPLLRSWGINALPTLWIVDRAGNLTSLNASNDGATIIKRMLKQPGRRDFLD